jgi:hypothetical protein
MTMCGGASLLRARAGGAMLALDVIPTSARPRLVGPLR